MGKTVPSYRLALEDEIARWRPFRKALRTDEERDAFDALMDLARNSAMAGGNACNPVLFEPMVMSIILGLQLQAKKFEQKLHEIHQLRICTQAATK